MNSQNSPSTPTSEGSGESGAPHPRPALWLRLLLLGLGWFLLLIGIAGLVLPGIQGVLTMLIGAAILSIASETAYRLLRGLLHERWPGLWTRLNGFRDRWRGRLARWR